jgi:hypothetical protein
VCAASPADHCGEQEDIPPEGGSAAAERAKARKGVTITRWRTPPSISTRSLSHLRNRVQITGDLNPSTGFRVVIPIGRRRLLMWPRGEDASWA